MNTLAIIKQILVTEMELDPSRVWAINGTQDLPKDNKLFIVLRLMNSTTYANDFKFVGTSTNLKYKQALNVVEDISISLISQNLEARTRAHDALMALNSFYSNQQQEKYQIHITSNNHFEDASFLEAASRLNRYDIRCKVFRAYDKIKDIDYYDKFRIEVWTDPNGQTNITKFSTITQKLVNKVKNIWQQMKIKSQ